MATTVQERNLRELLARLVKDHAEAKTKPEEDALLLRINALSRRIEKEYGPKKEEQQTTQ